MFKVNNRNTRASCNVNNKNTRTTTWCITVTRTSWPGTLELKNRDPGPYSKFKSETWDPLKFKSGTLGPPSEFKSGTPGLPSKFKSWTPGFHHSLMKSLFSQNILSIFFFLFDFSFFKITCTKISTVIKAVKHFLSTVNK